MNWALRIGLDMVIYPEGTCNRTNDPSLKNFYDGAFKLAVNAMEAGYACISVQYKKILPPDKGFYLHPQN